jgi:hypothetical protein
MRNWFLQLSTATAVLLMSILPAAGQATYRAPRGPDGHPDLNGIWQALSGADWDLEGHAAQASLIVEAGTLLAEPGGMSVVDGGTIPYKPEAMAKKKQNYDNRLTLDPVVKCYLPGVPRATYMPFPFQIFQSDKYLAIAYEFDSAFRNIYLKDPGPAPVDTWMGQSYGRWEGDTLVVDVTGLDERTWFDRAGDYHSDSLHVVERYTPIAPNILNYEATIDDPKTFTRQWKISLPLYKHVEKNAQLIEFKCVEFVEELMYGKYRKK